MTHYSMNTITHIVDPELGSPKDNATLAQLIEYYSRNEVTLSEEYMTKLCRWMRNLETNYYKATQRRNDKKLSKRLDRVILFVQFAKENKEKDGALLMSMWRWQFPNVEVLLMLRSLRISVADDRPTVLGKLRHPDLEYAKQLLAIKNKLVSQGKQLTFENALVEWTAHKQRVNKDNKPLGKKATEHFRNKYDQFRQAFDMRQLLERSWSSRSDCGSSNT